MLKSDTEIMQDGLLIFTKRVEIEKGRKLKRESFRLFTIFVYRTDLLPHKDCRIGIGSGGYFIPDNVEWGRCYETFKKKKRNFYMDAFVYSSFYDSYGSFSFMYDEFCRCFAPRGKRFQCGCLKACQF